MPSGGAIFFVVFWIITLAAFIFSARHAIRRVYLVFFFACLIFFGFAGYRYCLWPFHDWHLWGGVLPPEGHYHELYAVDKRGELFLYDSRAIPPKLPTQTQTIALQLLSMQEPQAQIELTQFLLDKANNRRYKLLDPTRVLTFPAFPAREFGYAWNRTLLENSTPFEKILARQIHFQFSGGGEPVNLETTMEQVYP
jgi:hypothetical protein